MKVIKIIKKKALEDQAYVLEYHKKMTENCRACCVDKERGRKSYCRRDEIERFSMKLKSAGQRFVSESAPRKDLGKPAVQPAGLRNRTRRQIMSS